MAKINYTKEWQRIVTTLERTEVRLLKELELSGADDERADATTKLEQVRTQLAHARNEVARLGTHRGTSGIAHSKDRV